jgi:hypothetical protein
MYTVYMHEHRENGKKYIGITSQNVYERWGNGKCYKRTSYFRSAIDKYGWDMFRHEILYTDLTYEEACQIEKELIAKYRTNDRNYGYNNSCGGEKGALGNHHTLSEETKKKMSQAKRDVPRPKWQEGRKASEKSVQKLREVNERRKRTVVCIETGVEYSSLREASRLTGINISNLSFVCNGNPKYTHAGKLPDGTKLHWRYKDAE